MARDAYDETLSMRQAESVGERLNEILATAVTKLNNATNDFLGEMRDRWADEYAVKVANGVEKAMTDIVSVASKNNKSFFDTLKGTADAYAKLAGVSQRFGKSPMALKAAVNASIVKNSFDDDRVGFKDVQGDEAIIVAAYEKYVKDVQQIKNETNSKIRSINAFGNRNVQNNLGSAGKAIFEIMDEELTTTGKDIKECLAQTKANYAKLGSQATDAIGKLSSNTTTKIKTL